MAARRPQHEHLTVACLGMTLRTSKPRTCTHLDSIDWQVCRDVAEQADAEPHAGVIMPQCCETGLRTSAKSTCNGSGYASQP